MSTPRSGASRPSPVMDMILPVPQPSSTIREFTAGSNTSPIAGQLEQRKVSTGYQNTFNVQGTWEWQLMNTLFAPCTANIFYGDCYKPMAWRVAWKEYRWEMFNDFSNTQRLVFWTDASVGPPSGSTKELAAACAIVWRRDYYSASSEQISTHRIVLDSHDAPQAEFMALKRAIRVAVNMTEPGPKSVEHAGFEHIRNVTFYTDSETALLFFYFDTWKQSKQLTFPLQRDLAVAKFDLKMLSKRGIVVEMRWVPGHSTILGNNKADSVANTARKLGGNHGLPTLKASGGANSLANLKYSIKSKRGARLMSTPLKGLATDSRVQTQKHVNTHHQKTADIKSAMRSTQATVKREQERDREDCFDGKGQSAILTQGNEDEDQTIRPSLDLSTATGPCSVVFTGATEEHELFDTVSTPWCIEIGPKKYELTMEDKTISEDHPAYSPGRGPKTPARKNDAIPQTATPGSRPTGIRKQKATPRNTSTNAKNIEHHLAKQSEKKDPNYRYFTRSQVKQD